MYVVLFICVCYEIEHMVLKEKSLDFFFRKKSENSVEDDLKFILNNVINYDYVNNFPVMFSQSDLIFFSCELFVKI